MDTYDYLREMCCDIKENGDQLKCRKNFKNPAYLLKHIAYEHTKKELLTRKYFEKVHICKNTECYNLKLKSNKYDTPFYCLCIM